MYITIDKGHILSGAVMLLGVIFLWMGLAGRYKADHAVKLENLDITACKKGQYVEGTIHHYLGWVVPNLGNGHFSGTSINYTRGLIFGSSDFYTVEVADDKYMTVMISEPAQLDGLEQYQNGVGSSVSITGKVVRMPLEQNYEWFAKVFPDLNRSEIDAKISSIYAIETIDFNREWQRTYAGIALIVAAILIFGLCGGLRSIWHGNIR